MQSGWNGENPKRIFILCSFGNNLDGFLFEPKNGSQVGIVKISGIQAKLLLNCIGKHTRCWSLEFGFLPNYTPLPRICTVGGPR